MAVAEVSTLSGYQFDREELQYLTSTPGIQRTEYEKDDTKINIYLNPVRSLSGGTRQPALCNANFPHTRKHSAVESNDHQRTEKR